MEVVTPNEWLSDVDDNEVNNTDNNNKQSKEFFTKNKVDLKSRVIQLTQEKAALEQQIQQFAMWKQGMIELLRFKDNQLQEKQKIIEREKKIIQTQKKKEKVQTQQLCLNNEQLLKLTQEIINANASSTKEVTQQMEFIQNFNLKHMQKKHEKVVGNDIMDRKETEDVIQK
eukprot:UN11070